MFIRLKIIVPVFSMIMINTASYAQEKDKEIKAFEFGNALITDIKSSREYISVLFNCLRTRSILNTRIIWIWWPGGVHTSALLKRQ